MPKSAFKTSAIFISLTLLAVVTAYPVFAQGTATESSVRKQLLQKNTEIRKENITDKITAIRETEASRASAFKLKIQAFKNQVKASAAERINTNLNMVNQKQTAQMQKYLNTMSQILSKLEIRVNQGSPDIKDPASAKTAIALAKQTISTASAAVVTQAQKDYTIQVTSESKIKADAKMQRDKLHTDLLALRKTVIDAKQAVANAIRVAKSGPPTSSGLNKEGTASGKQ